MKLPFDHSSDETHHWTFFRSGGVDQVVLKNGEDIANLRNLDQKLWMALGMPTRGVEFDPKTADLLDLDGDGRIRPLEVIAAVEWAQGAFKNLDALIDGGNAVKLSNIKDEALLAGARRVLDNLGKADADAISIDDIADQTKIFSNTLFNGDGIVPAEAAEDEETRKAIAEIISVMGAVSDRSGKPGVNQSSADAFFDQASAYVTWTEKIATDATIAPLGVEKSEAALKALDAVKVKVNDFFARCRLAVYDARAVGALNREESEYLAMAAKDMTITDAEIAALPLASIAAGKALPLKTGLNPAWESAIAVLNEHAVTPVLGSKESLTAVEWESLQAKLAPFASWIATRPADAVAALGVPRLKEILAGKSREAISALIAKDNVLAGENAHIGALEKLVRFQRDLVDLLTNYVNFGDFYGQKGAVFQVGTLYLDARACSLCIEVADEAKHAAMAGLSGAYLAYCEIKRPGGLKRNIVAAFTDGDSDNLMVGRNGVFYDRRGNDWDATITRVVANPISIREAFWLPYKKFVRFIEDQVAKRAQSADEASTGKMSEAAAVVATADQKPATPAPAPAKKLDLGTIALIGAAVGGVSALVAGLLQSMFGLGIWLPLGIIGIIFLISGPSMLLAWLKLRNRNLGPILDANGWAINTKAKLNVPFGAALTKVAKLPEGAIRTMDDPFAEKKKPWKLYLAIAVLLVLSYLWLIGRLDGYLPESLRKVKMQTDVPVAESVEDTASEAPIEPPTAEAPAEEDAPVKAPVEAGE
ncbi:MAG TPA: hypothetical protein PJ991_01905 [Kiritimatiellia bacterium]|nr:hypothetical protein [Kiritimatiellia bacterium]